MSSPSSQRSTPSRPLTNGVRRPNGYHHSSHNSTPVTSPSRQLLEEFSRMLLNDDRAFKRSLDEQTAAQQKLHLDALERALAKHEEVRESAERARERVELELEKERRRREEEERKAVEKARRELEEQRIVDERRKLEELRAREDAREKAEQLKKDQDDERERQESIKREQEETRRREELRKKEEEAKKAQEHLRASQAALPNGAATGASQSSNVAAVATPPANQALPAAKPTPTLQAAPASSVSTQATNIPDGLVTSIQERDAVHQQYLDLHKRLKEMRKQVSEQAKQEPGLKNQLSDWRRAIKKCCGQLSKGNSEEVKVGNKRSMVEIVNHLDAAAKISEPSIDVTQYLVNNQQPEGANKQGPACLVFLLNHFAKNIIKQFMSESAVDPKSADPIGVLAVTVFARPQYLFNGQSLIDLLWAKYHVHCPILFGISGSERTKAGRTRLGWRFDPDTNSYVTEQEHYDRMSGLGVGYAAITLRDFSKSKNANPAPNRMYWQSLSRILNTPAAETQPTHFVVVKALIDQYVPRIIGTFGGAGIAVLRQALIAFPNEKGPQDDKGRKVPAVAAVQAMPMVLQRDHSLTL